LHAASHPSLNSSCLSTLKQEAQALQEKHTFLKLTQQPQQYLNIARVVSSVLHPRAWLLETHNLEKFSLSSDHMITAVNINTHEKCDKYLTSLTNFFSVPLVNENEYCYTLIQQPCLSYSVYHRRLQCMSESASAVRY